MSAEREKRGLVEAELGVARAQLERREEEESVGSRSVGSRSRAEADAFHVSVDASADASADFLEGFARAQNTAPSQLRRPQRSETPARSSQQQSSPARKAECARLRCELEQLERDNCELRDATRQRLAKATDDLDQLAAQRDKLKLELSLFPT